MSDSRRGASLSVRALAKINLTLRVTGVCADGYHELRTVFQSLAVHDTLTFRHAPGPLRIECDDPRCPTDRTNLVWRAAEGVWRAAGRRGGPRDVTIGLTKRIPLRSGLGGGSSDAAAAVRGLSRFWRAPLSADRLRAVAVSIGADVAYFFHGGTALGLDRGDRLFPLADPTPRWVALVVPAFGVSTKDAYGWFDAEDPPSRVPSRPRVSPVLGLPADDFRNDLEPPVVAHHPEIARIARALRRLGAEYAAMSGSGSAVFGLFRSKPEAQGAVTALARAGRRALVTRTVSRAEYGALSAPR